MIWLHPALEVVEVLAIVALALAMANVIQRLKDQGENLQRMPDLVAQLNFQEGRQLDELLVMQGVMLRRLEQIERRLPHGCA